MPIPNEIKLYNKHDFRSDKFWYFGKNHISRSTRQVYLKNEEKQPCVNSLKPMSWMITNKVNSSFPLYISCYEKID